LANYRNHCLGGITLVPGRAASAVSNVSFVGGALPGRKRVTSGSLNTSIHASLERANDQPLGLERRGHEHIVIRSRLLAAAGTAAALQASVAISLVFAVLDLFITHASNGATFTELDRQHLYRIKYQQLDPDALDEEVTAA
jgi:hypothetical protein